LAKGKAEVHKFLHSGENLIVQGEGAVRGSVEHRTLGGAPTISQLEGVRAGDVQHLLDFRRCANNGDVVREKE
jgi:hypothetical protein